jgi:hypothetical protein
VNHELQGFAPETGRILQLFSADVVVLLRYIKALQVVNRRLNRLAALWVDRPPSMASSTRLRKSIL